MLILAKQKNHESDHKENHSHCTLEFCLLLFTRGYAVAVPVDNPAYSMTDANRSSQILIMPAQETETLPGSDPWDYVFLFRDYNNTGTQSPSPTSMCCGRTNQVKPR